MVSRKVKFSISVEKIEVNFEGSQELGQQIQQGVQQALGGLMNAQGRLLSMSEEAGQVIDGKLADTPDNGEGRQSATNANGDKQKQQRPRRPKENSPKTLLRGLKQEGFFSQPRTVTEIQDKLKLKGHNLKPSTISARLQELTQDEELHRDKNESDNYVYKDCPFHAAPGTSSPADQPPQ